MDLPILKSINKEVKREMRNILNIKCPNCKRLVTKEELIKKGCYLCGFKLK